MTHFFLFFVYKNYGDSKIKKFPKFNITTGIATAIANHLQGDIANAKPIIVNSPRAKNTYTPIFWISLKCPSIKFYNNIITRMFIYKWVMNCYCRICSKSKKKDTTCNHWIIVCKLL